jgi:hypothetical protein
MAKDEVTPRRLTKDADRRLAALDRSAHAPVKKAAAKKPKRGEQGGLALGVAVILTCLGLGLWGWTHSSSSPNGATLVAVLLLGLVLAAAVLLIGTGRRRDDRDRAYTEEQLEHLQQDRSGAHYLDGA